MGLLFENRERDYQEYYYLLHIEKTAYFRECLWWKVGDMGYTTDILDARLFPLEKAKDLTENRIGGVKYTAVPRSTVNKVSKLIVRIDDLSDYYKGIISGNPVGCVHKEKVDGMPCEVC